MSAAPVTSSKATITVTTTSTRLEIMLTELRLPTIKRLAGDLCAQSDTEGWPAHRLLEALMEHEINEREARRIDRHRSESCLSPGKRLSSFDFAAVPNVSKAQVMALTEGTEWIERGANVLVFGPPGVGKSHLVSALGHALIESGRRVLFTRCSDMVQRLQAARRDLRLPQELAKLDHFDLLILDDRNYSGLSGLINPLQNNVLENMESSKKPKKSENCVNFEHFHKKIDRKSLMYKT